LDDNQKIIDNTHYKLAKTVAERFSAFTQVEAVTLGGSVTTESVDQVSDIDINVYTKDFIPLYLRKALVDDLGTTCADLDLQFWDLGDEWYHAGTGIEVLQAAAQDQGSILTQVDELIDGLEEAMSNAGFKVKLYG